MNKLQSAAKHFKVVPRGSITKLLFVNNRYQILIRLCGRLVTVQAVLRRFNNAGEALARMALKPEFSDVIVTFSNSR